MKRHAYLAAAIVAAAGALAGAEDVNWRPAKGPLATRWAKDVSPDNVHNVYPRPQMVRKDWTNLNGLWDYAIGPLDQPRPDRFDGKILVPFPIESALSGVMKTVGEKSRLWYRRTFDIPNTLRDDGRLLLHFGAVDWHAVVWLNGRKVGEHRGGYDPFTIDITDALAVYRPTDVVEPGGGQELVVAVWDPTDAGDQPRGKQVAQPRGIWYTPVTGIWQTVWLEPVPKVYIRSLLLHPDFDRRQVRLRVDAVGGDERSRFTTHVQVKPFELKQATAPIGDEIVIDIPDVRPWSPDDPYLYNVSVVLEDTNDVVTSYVGMRKIEVKKDKDGLNRLFLNDRPLFQFGPLDQGWWPDGLYTAPTDEALKYDIEMTKRMGFNMCRKHVKVEPERWYYWCDKLGLLVWQDMPNGDRHIAPDQPDIDRSAESEENFRREWQAIIDARRNHPSIVAWVPFNEGWGQFKTDEILAWTKKYDPLRLVDGPSGWTDRGSGDMHDMHSYPGPAMPQPEEQRAAVLGEFGGLGLPLEGHLWWDKRNWGYRTYKTRDALRMNYKLLMRRLHPLIGDGLAAAIYTQTTDVEGEVNGLMTYDRGVVKLGAEWLAETNRKLYGQPPTIKSVTILETSETHGQAWRYTTAKPGEGWPRADFDDSSWQEGMGGFGEKSTPGSVVRTDWKSDDIWLRRKFSLKAVDATGLHLRIHHDEDAEVYLDGRLIATLSGYETGYVNVELGDEIEKRLGEGDHVLAIHCHQTGGGQYIDAGLVSEIELPSNQ